MKIIDAVNVMLMKGGGIDPVSSVGSGSEESAMANKVLDEARKRILRLGFPFNSDLATFRRDSSNQIAWPAGVLHAVLPPRYVQRSGFVHDREEDTNELTRNFFDVTVYRDIGFEDVPDVVANAVMAEATRDFAVTIRTSRTVYLILRDEAEEAMIAMSIEYPAFIGDNEYLDENEDTAYAATS